MTPKRRKNRFFTPHSPQPRTRTTPAAPTAAHTSTTRRGASKSPERPPRSPACCSRANGVAAPRASAVRRENVGRPKTAPAHRPAPLVRARSRVTFPSRCKTPPPAQVADSARSATPVRPTFRVSPAAKNWVTSRPWDLLSGAGRSGARGGACGAARFNCHRAPPHCRIPPIKTLQGTGMKA